MFRHLLHSCSRCLFLSTIERNAIDAKDELAAKSADPTSHDENDDADDSDKQTPSVPDGPTYTFDVD